jgi:IclR family acetate operon transcriptional repressor
MNADRYLRSFHVLGLLVGSEGGLRLTQIKEALQLPVSSVHNMLQTMVAAEVLAVTPDLRYTIGPRMVGVSLSAVQSLDIRALARRPLQALARAVGADAYLAIQVGQRVFYADRATGTQRVSLDIRLGESLHLHSTAAGKLFAASNPQLAARVLAGPLPRQTAATMTDPALLRAEYDAILRRGHAISREEAVDGIVGFAVPVRQPDGKLAAAVHVAVIAGRDAKSQEKELVAAARDCAARIERALGHFEPSVAHPAMAVAARAGRLPSTA